jgi:phage shock protein C
MINSIIISAFCSMAMPGLVLAVALGLILGWLLTRPRSAAPPAAGQEPARLYRSRHLRMIAGICGGLGQYFNLDPTIVRLIWVVFALASFGLAIILYIIMAIVVPEEPLA